ncbi:Uncharacterised protein [Bordetella pertussis]|nr:Uncharacterised protein [Bordetella pertussis]CPM60831.1 Uncharacterised protein [Bordetella pertussis]
MTSITSLVTFSMKVSTGVPARSASSIIGCSAAGSVTVGSLRNTIPISASSVRAVAP